MTWENRTETFTLPRVKQTTRVSSMHEAGHQTQYPGTAWRDGVKREVGGVFRMGDTYLWPIHAGVQQKPSQYCKAIILQLK